MNEIILTNPITSSILNSVYASSKKINFAVPFLNSFANVLLNETTTSQIADKRLLTRLDDSNLITFEIPTLQILCDLGFIIRFDNKIHLKLYITDFDTYVTSSNLTKGGFESNIELTIKVDSANSKLCSEIFNQLWENSKENEVNADFLKACLPKYEILKKRDQFKDKDVVVSTSVVRTKLDMAEIIDEIIKLNKDYTKTMYLVHEANKLREILKSQLRTSFSTELFYTPANHTKRQNNLFYDFTYGHEVKLAGTGLREKQFKAVFEHPEFKKVIQYIFPEMEGMKAWNLKDDKELLIFCQGIFDFKIPQYSEALPIRLASYFYPDYFLPIFKLDHLKKVSDALNINTDAKTNGERLYAYTLHISEKLKALPNNNNYIKSNIAYSILYTSELYHKLQNGATYESIEAEYKKHWKKKYIQNGLRILKNLGAV